MTAIKYARKPSTMTKMYMYIDNRIGHDLSGRIFFYNGKVEIAFNGVINMVKQIGEAFDRIACPQPSFEFRNFNEKAETKVSGETSRLENNQVNNDKEHELKATFVIQIKYRQNATWQGEIKWVNQNKSQCFRSSLEMIKLMDSAIASESGEDIQVGWG